MAQPPISVAIMQNSAPLQGMLYAPISSKHHPSLRWDARTSTFRAVPKNTTVPGLLSLLKELFYPKYDYQKAKDLFGGSKKQRETIYEAFVCLQQKKVQAINLKTRKQKRKGWAYRKFVKKTIVPQHHHGTQAGTILDETFETILDWLRGYKLTLQSIAKAVTTGTTEIYHTSRAWDQAIKTTIPKVLSNPLLQAKCQQDYMATIMPILCTQGPHGRQAHFFAILQYCVGKNWYPFAAQYTVGDAKWGVATKIDLLCHNDQGGIIIVELKCGYTYLKEHSGYSMAFPFQHKSDCPMHQFQLMCNTALFEHQHPNIPITQSVVLVVSNGTVQEYPLEGWVKKKKRILLQLLSGERSETITID